MPSICPYCRTPIEGDEIPECPSCHVPHHLECWLENKGCSIPGCSQAPDDESKIVVPGQSVQPPAIPVRAIPPPVYQKRIPNYLLPSILVTLFCCLPIGIPAIVFAAQVNTKLAAGDYAGARDSSDNARLWCWISFGIGLGILLLSMLGAAFNNAGR